MNSNGKESVQLEEESADRKASHLKLGDQYSRLLEARELVKVKESKMCRPEYQKFRYLIFPWFHLAQFFP